MDLPRGVALAPEGLRREIGGISLHHNPVHGQPLDDFQSLSCIFIGDDASEGQHPAQLHQHLGVLQTPGVAVVHATDLRMGPNHLQTVLVGLPVMDDDRQVQLRRQLQLPGKHLLLKFSGGIVLPVVVDLSDGPYLWVGGQGPQLLQPAVLPRPAVRGVNPHSGVDKGKLFRQGDGGPGALQVAARIQDQLHPLLRHGGQRLQPVAVESPGIVVGMGIK